MGEQMTIAAGLKISVRRRFEFLEFNLSWEGSVGRKKLQGKFSISPQQATKDLNAYLDIAPGNMFYDPRRKAYIRGAKYKPVFTTGRSSEYLMQIEMLLGGYRTQEEIWISDLPSIESIRPKQREIDPTILNQVLSALRNKNSIEVKYTSLSSGSSVKRRISPHALASDGNRWHIRAFDHAKEEPIDFVLSRIEATNHPEESTFDSASDEAWNTFVDLCLEPDRSLSQEKRARLASEYDMVDESLVIPVRKAMLFYCLRQYGFDPRRVNNGPMKADGSFGLSLKSLDQVEEWLERWS